MAKAKLTRTITTGDSGLEIGTYTYTGKEGQQLQVKITPFPRRNVLSLEIKNYGKRPASDRRAFKSRTLPASTLASEANNLLRRVLVENPLARTTMIELPNDEGSPTTRRVSQQVGQRFIRDWDGECYIKRAWGCNAFSLGREDTHLLRETASGYVDPANKKTDPMSIPITDMDAPAAPASARVAPPEPAFPAPEPAFPDLEEETPTEPSRPPSLKQKLAKAAADLRKQAAAKEREIENVRKAIDAAEKSKGVRCKVLAREKGLLITQCDNRPNLFVARNRQGKQVGFISLSSGGGDLYYVSMSNTDESVRGEKIGTALYEAAVEDLCKRGKLLASGVDRSRYSENLWRKQVRKGRAVCRNKVKGADGTAEARGRGYYYSSPWDKTLSIYTKAMAKATTEEERRALTETFTKLDAYLPAPPETGGSWNGTKWQCRQYRTKASLCDKKSIDLGKIPRRCPPGYRRHTAKNGRTTCRKQKRRA